MASDNSIWNGSKYRHPSAWAQDFAPMTVPQMFAASVRDHPDAPLVDFLGRKFSYSALAARAMQVAAGLTDLGMKPGDRVGLFLPNVPHYVAAYYGAMIAGMVVVNFSPLYSAAELGHQVEDSGTRLLITVDATALLPTALKVLEESSLEKLVVGSVAEGLPTAKGLAYRLFKRADIAAIPKDKAVTRWSDLIDNRGEFAGNDPKPEDVALLQYTGGTTGTPKGAMLTHQNLTANARQIQMIDPGTVAVDRIMGVLPLFHVFANACVLNRTVLRGGEIVMLPRFDAGDALKAIQRTKPVSMPGVPTMYQALLDHPAIGKTDFTSLQYCISGGAPLAQTVKTRWEEATGSQLIEGYGLTESSGVVSSNPYIGAGKIGTIGQPIPGTRIRLLDKEDPSKPAPEGEPGELTFAGPQVMKGYWRRPDADAKVFDGEFLRTGDVATIDEDGFVAIVDRLKDMISVGGFKVFPSHIEDVLYTHEAVRDALVIGVPDDYHGELPKAFVTLNDGADVDGQTLMAWLNPKVGKHERVNAVVVRDELPKTMIGKLDRKALRAEEGV
ncbi:long-chain-fatty-acid--CoA ligase [Novosphingopyxis baekryungensis]|uniref:long-chain-fatty-acid--CoA ligase n=1 Tax=Novosphingopyxis baekryungensis TaxID=279369 RepID=UPI0003B4F493|nr:long-chain fatty acid--CoA ligase [Novosphingopyxis baekryungensis]